MFKKIKLYIIISIFIFDILTFLIKKTCFNKINFNLAQSIARKITHRVML